MDGLGSNIKARGAGISLRDANESIALGDGQPRIVAAWIQAPNTTITGVAFVQRTQGSYTADNYNGVGLYSYDAGDGSLTLVASSTDDGNLWKAAANAYVQKPFTTPYVAGAGAYFIVAMYSTSSQTTAPQLSGKSANNAIAFSASLTGVSMSMLLSSQTAIPTPSNVSSWSAAANFPALELY
jgi:hypothetical protein